MPSEAVISVVGTTSSGKSTMLNALLGTWLLPSGVQETTIAPTRVKLTNTATDWLVTQGTQHERFADVGALRAALRRRMTTGNTQDIAIIGPLPQRRLIERIGPAPQLPHASTHLVFEDLPGLLDRHDSDRLLTYQRRLPQSSVVLVLLNARETDVGKSRLVAEIVINSISGTSVPIIWALTHVDEFNRDDEPAASLAGAQSDWSDYLSRLVGTAPPLVSVSAHIGLAALRLLRAHKLEKREQKELGVSVRLAAGASLPDEILPPSSPSDWGFLYRVRLAHRLWAASGIGKLERRLLAALETRPRVNHRPQTQPEFRFQAARD